MDSFSNTLIPWYLQNKRDLPWRNTTDPYVIWLSEIILQQTRVAQGLPYFNQFMDRFPTLQDLANADLNEILKLWQGLGYYSRARNLHFTAKFIVDELQGEFPDHYNGLLKLKGVGDYTASAIASICFNEASAVVDGNVYRVLARYFGISTPINSTQGITDFKALAQSLIDITQPANFNQAIMEFGAMMCTPKIPKCPACPLQHSCFALQRNDISNLPVKLKKTKIKKRFFNYLVIKNNENELLFEQRTKGGIWQGLYEFPLLETEKAVHKNTITDSSLFRALPAQKKIKIELFNADLIKHQLSHQTIYTKFWIIEVNSPLEKGVKWESITDFPVPVLIQNFIQKYKFDG